MTACLLHGPVASPQQYGLIYAFPAGQVSVFDTINSSGNYSKRVRRLGEFHPRLAEIMTPDGQDIDDPLYGNEGGASEMVCPRVSATRHSHIRVPPCPTCDLPILHDCSKKGCACSTLNLIRSPALLVIPSA